MILIHVYTTYSAKTSWKNFVWSFGQHRFPEQQYI